MQFLTTPSGAFPISLIYITVGVLIDVWTGASLIYYPPTTPWGHFLVVGFLITGLSLLIIGLTLGHIGRAARHAELPPAEVTPAVAEAEKAAANHPPAIVPGVLTSDQAAQVTEVANTRVPRPVAVPSPSNSQLLR